MSEANGRQQREQFYQHMTKSAFLHLEDALNIGKVRIFAGHYQRGQGTKVSSAHFIDLAAARVLFSDLAWGKKMDFCEFKGSPRGPDGKPVSRVLKIRSADAGKVWFRLEAGPGELIGEGAIKPAGEPTAVVNVPFTVWEARKLGFACLAQLQTHDLRLAMRGPSPRPLPPSQQGAPLPGR